MTRRIAAAAIAAAALAGCNATLTPAFRSAPSARRDSRQPITHIVFIVQENRSFNNLFMGFPGATTQTYGYDTKGRKIQLHAQDLHTFWDIDHSATAFFTACNGRGKLPGTECAMNGWNAEKTSHQAPKDFAYAYVPRSEIRPYWQIAHDYVLADRTFASNLDGSFVSHQYVVAAESQRAVDYPLADWGCEGAKSDTLPTLTQHRTFGRRIRPCFDIPTIASEADASGITWRFYAGPINGDGGVWSSYQANRPIFGGPDWNVNVINPPAQFLTDVANGQLANVTWITPSFADSDHPGLPGNGGPAWVASLVNAVGTSKFWKTSAIFIIWDDWGGWFDPVKPPYMDYDGLGFRVPLLIVSPYARPHYVSHVQYETSSVLRYVEDNFGLPPLAHSDARAADPAADVFNFKQRPRAFKKIGGAKPSSYWLHAQRKSTLHGLPPGVIGDD